MSARTFCSSPPAAPRCPLVAWPTCSPGWPWCAKWTATTEASLPSTLACTTLSCPSTHRQRSCGNGCWPPLKRRASIWTESVLASGEPWTVYSRKGWKRYICRGWKNGFNIHTRSVCGWVLLCFGEVWSAMIVWKCKRKRIQSESLKACDCLLGISLLSFTTEILCNMFDVLDSCGLQSLNNVSLWESDQRSPVWRRC